jgi:RNA polymerase primary sigma factor
MFHHCTSGANKQRREDANIRAYLQDLAHIPILSTDMELHLFQQIAGAPHSEAAHVARTTLVEAHLHLVVDLARDYLSPDGSFPDLIQEGNLALIEAVQRFNPLEHQHVWAFASHAVRTAIVQATVKDRLRNHVLMLF